MTVWSLSVVANDCPDTFSSKEPGNESHAEHSTTKEPISYQSAEKYNLTRFVKDNKKFFDILENTWLQQYKGKYGLVQFIEDYLVTDIQREYLLKILVKQTPQNTLISMENKFIEEILSKYPGIGSTTVIIKNDAQLSNTLRERFIESVQLPADYTSIKIDGYIWFAHKNIKPEEINTVRTILSEKNKLNDLFKEIGREKLVFEVSEIWKQFDGSIDKFLAVRKESDFTEFRITGRSPWHVMDKYLGPARTRAFLNLLYPVLTMQEIQLLRNFNDKQLMPQPLLNILTGIFERFNPLSDTEVQEHQEKVKEDLARKIIRIWYASRFDLEKHHPDIKSVSHGNN